MVFAVMGLLLPIWTAFADTHIPAGNVYGTWTSAGSPYLIDGEITIPTDSTLTIQPGVDIIFQGQYGLTIHGYLYALGSINDSIMFTSADTIQGWKFLYFENSPDSSILMYCTVRHAYSVFGAIYCRSSNPIISNSIITYDSTQGILCFSASPSIRFCIITNNRGYGSWGILCVYSSRPIISDCTISYNGGHLGGGIYSGTNSNPTIRNCTVSNNDGPGIDLAGYTATVDHCLITNNSGELGGGIITNGGNNITISFCTISANSGDGIWGGWSFNATLTNSIITDNLGAGVRFYVPENFIINYCDISGNDSGSFSGLIPDSLGEIVTTNANGDSCDAFFNIFLNPQFVDTLAGDYHLQSTSPCIDAGNPTSPHDPDSTIADLGAFCFNQLNVPDRNRLTLPSAFQLHQNYPNPFNSSTSISISLPIHCKPELNIYDITGRHIATLMDDWHDAGIHRITFDASNLSSGIYFYQLKANNFTDTKKMVFIK